MSVIKKYKYWKGLFYIFIYMYSIIITNFFFLIILEAIYYYYSAEATWKNIYNINYNNNINNHSNNGQPKIIRQSNMKKKIQHNPLFYVYFNIIVCNLCV